MKRKPKNWTIELHTRTALVRRGPAISMLPLSVSLCPMHFPTKNRWFVYHHYWRFVIELDHIPFIVHGAILSAVSALGHPLRMNFHWLVKNMISSLPHSAWSTCMDLVKMASNNRKASIVSTRWIIFHTFSMFDTNIYITQYLHVNIICEAKQIFSLKWLLLQQDKIQVGPFIISHSSLSWQWQHLWPTNSFHISACWCISKPTFQGVKKMESWYG